ncbi:hypothetical protein [Ammoniphilus sp. 3BR4]|uniref:hypothetical protein n=1 Tax=Ammoniphilus sp. 3BR4 TaxID=3158265 RepID=UPI0034661054
MDRKTIEEWFEKEREKAGESNGLTNISFQEKWLAFSLVAVVPVVLTGCAPEPTAQQPLPRTENTSISSNQLSNNQNLTAYDECMWERESLGEWEIDCGDDSSSWYSSRGYSSRHSYVPSTSRYYRMVKGDSPSSSTAPSSSAPSTHRVSRQAVQESVPVHINQE